ncbi:MAG: GTP-binding protein, partial [Candidatus Vogelbacteria bacterium]|nr:GTP-binding protein [Candidatus Vogelbacteria bacterium]
MARDYPLEKVRNIGIIAHIDAGKTTVSERVLFYTGVSHKIGEVHEGEATMDWMEQEQERGITITSAATTAFWNPTYEKDNTDHKCRLNIIDTPGHIDFTVEVKRSLRVLDGAVVIFDGVAGVEPQSETNWRYADEGKVPRMCFVNKLDRMGASFDHSFKTILDRLSKKAVRIQIPIGVDSEHEGVIDLMGMKGYLFEGDKGKEIKEIAIPEKYLADAKEARAELVERIAEHDEQLTTDFLEGKEILIPDFKRVLRKATIANDIFPV